MVRFLSHIIMYLCTTAILAQAVAEEMPDSSKVHTLLEAGDTFYNTFENRQALDSYSEAYTLAPESFEVLSKMVRTQNDYALDLLAEQRDDEARMLFTEAIKHAQSLESLYPDKAASHYFQALIKTNLAQIEGNREKMQLGREIEKHCANGFQLKSEMAELHIVYALFNRDIAGMNWVERTFTSAIFGRVPDGSPEQAIEFLQKAVEINPTLHLAQFEIARTYVSMGYHEEAIPYLENAVALPAQTTQDNRNRALAQRMLDQVNK